jgi:hypothetical protein
MSLTYISLFINDRHISSSKLDSRITLDEYRTFKPLSETMNFLHNKVPISLESEKDIKLCDIIDNNEIHIIDSIIETDITANNKLNDGNFIFSQEDNDEVETLKEKLLCTRKRTRRTRCLHESIFTLISRLYRWCI